MPDQVWRYVDIVTRNASQLEREHWVALSVIVLLLGLACMRGFGSRNNY
ncbi:MAG: hypothetical protein WD872_04875 [Pirellulaceae bacterium]